MSRCECCDLPDYSCGKTAETAQRRERDALRRALVARGWTPAHYRGICACCGQRFDIDQLIKYVSGNGGWKSECCAPDTLRDLGKPEVAHGARRGP